MRPDGAEARRRAAYRRGLRAEVIALALLSIKGYRPLARRFSASGGEIDLIVRRGRNVVFVEVKARPTLLAAQEAISHRKQQRFSRAVRAWLGRNPHLAGLTFRADAVFLEHGAWPMHLVDAFPIEGL
ncbi:putative endonuclease [Methylobacterium sp. BE186]|uniref:YraN family protein n=1 Tax=Methylobacterium sp. BE186 TaxID=2817715 RepID=UPI00285606F5|nr:YraN family protein [Methylobacterium sp. BE186]MDR7036288.1 putative endonuclease [Methylobacterium sp. BE186]